jgi:hypothetical protein
MTIQWRDRYRNTVHSEAEAARFVAAVGCCTINQHPKFPEFPSLAVAMGEKTALWTAWWWKDDLHVNRQVYYTRLFDGWPGFLSLALLPAFIAANGEVADEVRLLGTLPLAALDVYEIIARRGPISSRVLKKELPPEARKAATRHLWDLERRFMITKVEITGRTLQTYSYVWDLAERWMPDAFAAADTLGRQRGRALILAHLAALGVEADARLQTRLLHWGTATSNAVATRTARISGAETK